MAKSSKENKRRRKGQWEAKNLTRRLVGFLIVSVFDWATLFCRVCHFLLSGPVVRGGDGSQVSEKED